MEKFCVHDLDLVSRSARVFPYLRRLHSAGQHYPRTSLHSSQWSSACDTFDFCDFSFFDLYGVHSRSGQSDAMSYIIIWCKRVVDCRSVNVYVDTVSSSVTCEALTAYLHQVTTGTTTATNWFFIQEDPVWKNASMALAFRATAGNGLSVFDTWYQSGRHDNPQDMRSCIHPFSPDPCVTHFRSYILDTWININKVLIQLYKNGAVVKEITFDGRGSSVTSWMSKDRLLTSSWTDMTPTSSASHFSLAGMDYVYRRFYINAYLIDCTWDAGWLMVADVHPEPSLSLQCPYENGLAKPVLIFLNTSTAAAWPSVAKDTANFMMVYVSFL